MKNVKSQKYQELVTHERLPPVFSRVRVAQTLVFCVVWYFQTVLANFHMSLHNFFFGISRYDRFLFCFILILWWMNFTFYLNA
jgi:hypothetical protein